MNPSIRIATFVLGFMAFGAFAAGGALADDAGVRLNTSDLDLSTAKGVNTLYGRIEAAANSYCRNLNTVTGTRIARGMERCITDAVGHTVRSINLPALSALHADLAAQKHRG